MDEEQFNEHMCVGSDGTVPDFYEQYALEICHIVENNAAKEFEYIWANAYEGPEHLRKRSTETTDSLSEAMNNLNDTVGASDLFENKTLVAKILASHIPKVMVDKVGMNQIMERVPDNYLRAIFSMGIATQFIYKYGDVDSPYYFYKFMEDLGKDDWEPAPRVNNAEMKMKA